MYATNGNAGCRQQEAQSLMITAIRPSPDLIGGCEKSQVSHRSHTSRLPKAIHRIAGCTSATVMLVAKAIKAYRATQRVEFTAI
jgi:hypothetical protein